MAFTDQSWELTGVLWFLFIEPTTISNYIFKGSWSPIRLGAPRGQGLSLVCRPPKPKVQHSILHFGQRGERSCPSPWLFSGIKWSTVCQAYGHGKHSSMSYKNYVKRSLLQICLKFTTAFSFTWWRGKQPSKRCQVVAFLMIFLDCQVSSF